MDTSESVECKVHVDRVIRGGVGYLNDLVRVVVTAPDGRSSTIEIAMPDWTKAISHLRQKVPAKVTNTGDDDGTLRPVA